MNKLKNKLMSPDEAGGGGPATPAGNVSGGSGGASTGASPKSVFGDMEAPASHNEGAPVIAPTRGPKASSVVAAPNEPEKIVKPAAQVPNEPVAPVAAPVGTTMTDEQLTKLANTLAAGVRAPTGMTQEQKEERREMTPEERVQFDKQFQVVRVTPEMFKGIMGYAAETPEQLKALENFAHSIMRMSASTTLYETNRLMQQREEAVRAEFGPIREAHIQQTNARMETELFAAHPDLKDFAPLLVEISKAAKADGIKFKTPAEAYNFVANKARTLLGKSAPASSTQGRETATRKPAMPTTSMGGRSASPSSSPQTAASGPKAVFGDLDGSS